MIDLGMNRVTFLRAAIGGFALAAASNGSAAAAAASGPRMRGGVTYDTGVLHFPGEPLSRVRWDRTLMEQEIRAIRKDMRCDSIVVFGSEIGRLTETTAVALQRNLRVFVQPRLYDHPQREILDHLAETAREAEQLRRHCGIRLTLVVGCEFLLFTPGIVPGVNFLERIQNLQKMPPEEYPALRKRLEDYMRRAVSVARANFHGRITYGATTGEPVDWSLFDIVGLDYYEYFREQEEYSKDLARYRKWGKPITILEFGSCTYTGAPERGGMGWDGVIDWEVVPPQVKDAYVRDERAQADHIARMLRIFERETLMGAHVYTFISPDSPHSPIRELDLDIASYSLAKVIRENYEDPESSYRWEPKEAFHALKRHNCR
ncbi:hypothetical protein GCM10012275_08810 [Longimycelium tulufanense]|uniref:Abortive infection protein n=1 Tax=Longimycelium tulufanense TaxID=907463 RepID=A0A8J3FU38_9PSEU|nr:abortive phage infection protein [Longimycelium tulufanense]GGM40093.1 hypothetical protein GCM10012275_08810 [Longimycelium tulufanense]